MARKKLYGLEAHQEARKEKIIRDIRTPWERFSQGLISREGYVVFSGGMVAWLLLAPGFWPIPVLLFFLLHRIRKSKTKEDHLPMRMPGVHDGLDYNNPAPGRGFKKAGGMFYIGNDFFGNNDELWICKDDILTHMLVLGTTGAGKTETLVSLCYNYLAVGSGLIYVDPKAAPKLGAQIYTMCRLLGRDDDFLLINYMTNKLGQETQRKYGHTRVPIRQSNTMNPFAVGDANQLTQLLFALMPGDDGGGNSIFQQNAQTLISGLMFVLVEMRNNGERPLSVDLIRYYLTNIPAIDELARDEGKKYSELAVLALQSGLATVGWDKSKGIGQQSKNFPEQFSYARAYFGRALSLLVDNYGPVFNTTHGEVDAVDVITSRRIYVTLIPSMDKDPKELKSLGQICLAAVRNACAIGLGDKVQGKIADVLGALPTESRAPYGIIVDEYAAIETPGFEILLTQGRGLGMAIIVASQDMAGIQRASEAAAEQIVSNCKVKIFMTTEDPNKTYTLINQLAGESLVMESSGYSIDRETSSTAYLDNRAVSAQMRKRVDFRDLQKQIEGDCTIFFKGEMIRGRTFYAAPPLKNDQDVRLAYHLKCMAPNKGKVDDIRLELDDFKSVVEAFALKARAVMDTAPVEGNHDMQADNLKAIRGVLSLLHDARSRVEIGRNDVGISALMVHDATDSAEVEELAEQIEMPEIPEIFPEEMDDDDDNDPSRMRSHPNTGFSPSVRRASAERSGAYREATDQEMPVGSRHFRQRTARRLEDMERKARDRGDHQKAKSMAEDLAGSIDASLSHAYPEDPAICLDDKSQAEAGLNALLEGITGGDDTED